MSSESVELVRCAYTGYAQRDVELARDLAAEDFRFHMRPEWPVQGAYSLDEIPRLWADLDETFSEWTMTPQSFDEVGDYVIVPLVNSTRVRGSEARMEEPVHHVWLVRDGLIREAWTFTTYDEARARAEG